MLQFVESSTERRLRNSKDDIVDRIIMPFVQDTTAKFLTKPYHLLDTPKVATQAFKAGAITLDDKVAKKQKHVEKEKFIEKELVKKIKEINNQEPSSIEMLVAVNMISHA